MADFAQMIYGTAQNVAQEVGNKASEGQMQGLKMGHEIAQAMEQSHQNRAIIEQKKEELQLAKVDKLAEMYKTGYAMEDGGDKQAYLNHFMPNAIQAMGMGDAMHPVVQKMAATNPGLIPYVQNEIANHRLNPSDLYGAMASPDKAAKILGSDGFKQFGAAQEIRDALQNSIGAIKKTATVAASDENKYWRAKAAAEASAKRQENQFAHDDNKQLQSFKTHIVDTTNKTVVPLAKEAGELATAQLAGQRLQKAIDSGNSNYKGAAQDAEAVKMAFLRSVVSRVTQAELDAVGISPGLLGQLKNRSIKYGTGGFNPESIGGIIRLVNEKSSTLNEHLEQQKQLVQDEVNNSQFKDKSDEILKPVQNYFGKMQGDISKKSPGGNGLINIGGKGFTVEGLQRFLKDHPTDDRANEVKDALKKAGVK